MKSIALARAIYRLLMIGVLSFSIVFAGYGQGDCGNDDDDGPDGDCCPPGDLCCLATGLPPCKSGGKFSVYTGNVHREIKDLELWGSVGRLPMVWMRYYNSRGWTLMWNYSFHFYMFNSGTNSQGQPRINIHYPQGGENVFTQSKTDPELWLPVPGVGKRLFQQGNNFWLQLGDGNRYRFEKLTTSSGKTYYQLQEIMDNQENSFKLTYNSSQLLTRVTEPAGRYFAITYSTVNKKQVITKVSTSDGRSVQYNWDVYNDGVSNWERLISVNYGDGTQALYTYKPASIQAMPLPLLEHAIDPRYVGPAANMIYLYDNTIAGGFVREEHNGKTGEVMATLISEPGKRTVCFPNGQVNVLNFAAGGDLTGDRDGLGRLTKYTYDEETGFIKTIEDALGRVTVYNERTIYGNPLMIIHPDGSVEKWTRDELDLELTYTDGLGRVTTYTRDGRHRITRTDYPDGSYETYAYNSFGQVVDHRRRNGGMEHTVYDNRGLLTSFTDALGNVTTYTYTTADLPASTTDARRNTTQQEYNERGLLTKLNHADGGVQTYQYDDFGNRTAMVNELGNKWTSVYDEFKRLVSMADPLGRTIQFSYDLLGGVCGCAHTDEKPTKITLPGGLVREIEYNIEWELVRKTDGAGTTDEATTFYEYDLVGNLATMIDSRGKQWRYEYDTRNRRIAETDLLGNRNEWTYDAVGNQLTQKRQDGGIFSYGYDVMNRPTMTTDSKSQVVKMRYDAEGNRTKLTDPKNNSYSFEYDLLSRLTRMVYPDGSSEKYAYDAVNNLIQYTAVAGQVRTYTYDNRNREIQSTWASPFSGDVTPAVSRNFDAAGRLLTMTSNISALSYTYNAANELTSETQKITGASKAKTVSYTYNDDALLKTMAYPNGNVVNYTYTGRNQVAGIASGGPTVQYSYDPNGNRASKTLQNGTTAFYTYDDANRLLQLAHQKAGVPFAQLQYGYDQVGNRTFAKRENGKGEAYRYDAIDQVTKVFYEASTPDATPTGAARTVDYTWDAAGNRESMMEGSSTLNYMTNALNQYTSVGPQNLGYYINKNLKYYEGWTFSYDAQNRLIKAVKGSAVYTFAYDGRNRCVQRTINGVTAYLYYSDWNLIEERTAADVEIAHYVHGAQIDELLKKVSGSGVVYYHQDGLGSTTHLTNAAGSVVEQYSYDVFGAPTIKTGSGAAIGASAYGNRFLFTGREYFTYLNLYDYRNRMYSPQLGRFLQKDPIRFEAGDYNLYRYVGNNPVNWSDPLGLITCKTNENSTPEGAPTPDVRRQTQSRVIELELDAKGSLGGKRQVDGSEVDFGIEGGGTISGFKSAEFEREVVFIYMVTKITRIVTIKCYCDAGYLISTDMVVIPGLTESKLVNMYKGDWVLKNKTQ